MAGTVQWRMSMYVDRPGVMKRLGAWQHMILSRSGAYGQGVFMKKLGRPPLVGRQVDRKVIVNGRLLLVQKSGLVVDEATRRPVKSADAIQARQEWLRRFIAYKTGKGEGRPPRLGPTGKLQRYNDFGIDHNDTVVMGTVPFKKQPELVKAVTVPDLLNAGGGERIAGQLVKYGPRPFVEVSLPPVVRFTKQLIKSNPVG